MKKKGKNVYDDFAQTFSGLKSSLESEDSGEESIEKKSIDKKGAKDNVRSDTIEKKSIEEKSKTIESIDSKRVKSNIENRTIEHETIEKKSIEKEWVEDAAEGETIEQNAIELKSIDENSIEQNKEETKPLGIHPTSIRVVKEELLKALAGQVSAEIKIGDIAPLTGLTRRTVDRVCKYLEGNGDFSFERQHRGMKVTALKS